ncbi:MAG: VWA domain-containing protein [Muribaculaceae bacterium]|nr:VWA domain-containing protein [Muribaculaceae bacterium]
MFSFAYPKLLMLLLLVPAFVALYAWARYARARNLRKFGKPRVLAPLMPEVSPYKPPIKITLQMLALALIVIAFARPWGGVKDEKTVKEGIEVVIAVDASNSMLASSTADDNGVDRMRTAKLILEKLINRLDNDRVGLIVYAGDAYTLIPVTSDYVSAKMFLNSIDPSQISNQGTDITAAIDMATKSFSEDKKIGKAIILITDAEDLEDRQSVMDAAKAAARNDIQLDVVGLGSTTPVHIPLKGGGYLIDPETGEPVRTALNEDLATEIASAGKGIYVNASNNDALNELDKQLDTVKKTALESSFSAIHDELFAIFVWIAIALIVLDIFVLDRKISWLDRITFFKKEEKR